MNSLETPPMKKILRTRRIMADGGDPLDGGPGPRKKLDWASVLGSFANTQLPDVDLKLNDPKVVLAPDAAPTTSSANDLSFKNTPDINSPDKVPYEPGMIPAPAKASRFDQILSGANTAAGKLAPFMSNIVNSFRRPPQPSVPVMAPYTTLNKIDLSAERSAVNSEASAESHSADRMLDENSAIATKQFIKGTAFGKLNSINERETNTNVGIGNAQAEINAGTSRDNTNRQNEYGVEKVERRIAQQREQSQNLANAGQKAVEIGNEERKAKVDQQKTRVLSTIFSNSGVLTRAREKMMEAGNIDDPLGMDYKDIKDAKKKKETDGTDVKKYGGAFKKLY